MRCFLNACCLAAIVTTPINMDGAYHHMTEKTLNDQARDYYFRRAEEYSRRYFNHLDEAEKLMWFAFDQQMRGVWRTAMQTAVESIAIPEPRLRALMLLINLIKEEINLMFEDCNPWECFTEAIYHLEKAKECAEERDRCQNILFMDGEDE